MQYSEMMFGEDGQQILLDIGVPKPEMEKREDDLKTNLAAEYEALGIMVSGSRLSFIENKLKAANVAPLSEIPNKTGSFLTAGIIKSARSITTKTGKKMAFMELYDDLSEASFILFDEVFNSNVALLKTDNIVLVRAHKGNRRYQGGEESFVVEELSSVGE